MVSSLISFILTGYLQMSEDIYKWLKVSVKIIELTIILYALSL